MIEPYALVRAASKDERLSHLDIRIYVALVDELDFEHHRPIKQAWLARRVQHRVPPISRSLQRLTEAGWLERRRRKGLAWLYRLKRPTPPISVTSNAA